MLKPGLTRETDTPKPKIPIFGSYLIPGISICSKIPNDTFPSLSKDFSLISLPFASNNFFSNICARFYQIGKIIQIFFYKIFIGH